eukprot:s1342_g6.t3
MHDSGDDKSSETKVRSAEVTLIVLEVRAILAVSPYKVVRISCNILTHSLGGLAAASANVVAADKKAGKVGTPQHSARSTASRPIRANVPTRSPRQEQIQAQEQCFWM